MVDIEEGIKLSYDWDKKRLENKMKYKIFLLLALLLISCKNSTKKNNDKLNSKNDETDAINIIQEIGVANIDQWELRGIELIKTDNLFNNEEVYKTSVTVHDETYTFIAINNIKISYTGGRYRLSLIAKSIKENSNLGIRIQEVYPSRLDVVFDLISGKVRGAFKEGDFIENEKPSIVSLGDSWFKCTIETDIYSSYFRILFGPSNVVEDLTRSWESEKLNDKEREILIVPSSIKVEEIEN